MWVNRLYRSVCVVVGCYAAVPGCTVWRVESAAPQEVVARHPHRVKVQRKTGGDVVLQSPEIRRDSLVEGHSSGPHRNRRAVALFAAPGA